MPKGKYTLSHHENKIKGKRIKRAFELARTYLKTVSPELKEEYTLKRINYWNNSNECPFSIEPRRKAFWIRINGRSPLKGLRKRFDQKRTLFKITNKLDLQKVINLYK